MLDDYILGNEIAKKANISIANISMLIKNHNLINGIDFLKFKSINLINKNSLYLPRNIRKIIDKYKFTDLSEYVPYIYFTELFEFKLKNIKNFSIIKICNKKFVKINDKYFEKIIKDEKLVKVVVDRNEVKSLLDDSLIKGFKHLSKGRTFVWY